MSLLADAPRGQLTRTFLDTGEFRDAVRLRLPLIIARGAEDGPTLAVTAAQHGREVTGIAAIERALGQIDPAAMRGTIAFLPVMNPLAVRMRQQDYPFEHGRYARAVQFNQNRHWDGAGNYPLYTRVAEVANAEVIGHADVLLDIHGWSPGTVRMAWTPTPYLDLLKATGFDFIRDSGRVEEIDRPGILSNWFRLSGRPGITVEIDTQNIFSDEHVEALRRCIMNTARHLGLIGGEPEWPETQYLFGPESESELLTASCEGLVVFDAPKGAYVRKGQRVGKAIGLETLETLEEFVAPIDGVISVEHVFHGEHMPLSSMCAPDEPVLEVITPDEAIRR